MSLRAILFSLCVLPTLACGSKTDTTTRGSAAGDAGGRAGASHSAGRGGQGGDESGGHDGGGNGGAAGVVGSGGASGGGVNGDGGSGPTACIELESNCTYSSECCSHFCSEQTHTCRKPNFCPLACSADTYCSPGFRGNPNTCHAAPKPQCAPASFQAECNRCIVDHCPAEVVYCGCDDVCFGNSGGCLPTCGNTDFAGFNECIAAHCNEACN